MSNNSTIATSAVQPSQGETLMNGIITFTFGSASILLNALTLIAILRRKSLRTPCFSLIAAEAVFNWIVGVGFLSDGVQRIGVFAGVLGTKYSRLSCAFMLMPRLVNTSVAFLSCVISIDRMIGVTMPFRYKSTGRKTAIFGIIGAILLASAYILVAVITMPTPYTSLISCTTYVAAFHPTYGSYYKVLSFSLNTLLVFIYVITMSVIYRRRNSTVIDSSPSTRGDPTRILRKQLALFGVIRAMVASNMLFGCLTDMTSLIFTNLAGGIYLPRAALYTGCTKAVGTVSDFFILLAMSGEFRSTVKAMLCTKVGKTWVMPISMVSSGHTTRKLG